MRIRLWPLGAIFFACALCIAPANAAQLELGVGQTLFKPQPSEIWWEAGYPHEFSLRSTSFSVGATGTALPWLGWRAGYESLGVARSYATVLAHDPSYNEATHGCFAGADCTLARYDTAGRLQGVYATVTPTWHGAFIELGAWVYLPQFQLWIDGANIGSQRAHVQVGAVAGVGLTDGRFTVALNKRTDDATARFAPGRDDFLPSFYHGGAWNLSLRVTL